VVKEKKKGGIVWNVYELSQGNRGKTKEQSLKQEKKDYSKNSGSRR